MKLSANEEYGLRCLVRIGYAGDGGSLTIPEISVAEGVSPAYAAKILRVLRKGGFVKAARGKDGGYTLARPGRSHRDRRRNGRARRPHLRKQLLRHSLRPGRHLHPQRGLLRPFPLASRPGGGRSGPQQSHATRFVTERRRDEQLGPDDPRRQGLAVYSVKYCIPAVSAPACGAESAKRQGPFRRRVLPSKRQSLPDSARGHERLRLCPSQWCAARDLHSSGRGRSCPTHRAGPQVVIRL